MHEALLDVYNYYPFLIERGEGMYLYDTSGKRYLDLYGGHAVCIVGHSPKKVVDAIAEQGYKFMFYSNLVDSPIREAGARALLSFGEFNNHRVFFCNSGGEANENALKIAIKATGRQKIVGFKGAFHGRTMLAIGATDHSNWHEWFPSWMGPIGRITPNDDSEFSVIDENTAAVILEPIQSIGGVTVFELEYLKTLRKRCDEVGALLIFDEVQTGMGRTGVPFVSTGWSVAPDITTLAKGLGGGFPMGGVIVTEAVAKTIAKGDVAATFGGGPLAMAAMIAVIEVIKENNLVSNALAIEKHSKDIFSKLPGVKEVRGRGCLLGIVTNKEAKSIQTSLFDDGIITGPNSNPNLVHLLPPLNVTSEHLDTLQKALKSLLN